MRNNTTHHHHPGMMMGMVASLVFRLETLTMLAIMVDIVGIPLLRMGLEVILERSSRRKGGRSCDVIGNFFYRSALRSYGIDIIESICIHISRITWKDWVHFIETMIETPTKRQISTYIHTSIKQIIQISTTTVRYMKTTTTSLSFPPKSNLPSIYPPFPLSSPPLPLGKWKCKWK